jgi:hypothetical protein
MKGGKKSVASVPKVTNPGTKKRKRRSVRKNEPVKRVLELPPRPPRENKNAIRPPPVPMDNDRIEIIALGVARADSWKARKQYVMTLMDYYVTYQQLATIIHRFPSDTERLQTIELLKDRVRDSDHSFFLFSQGFALESERKAVSAIFNLPLPS